MTDFTDIVRLTCKAPPLDKQQVMAHLQVGNGGGSGYALTPTVRIRGGGASTDATATAIIDQNYHTVISITVDSGGSDYSHQPIVYISDPQGAGGKTASAMAIVDFSNGWTHGFVKQIILTGGHPGGYGYKDVTPTVAIEGSGSGAQAEAEYDPVHMRVTKINVIAGGANYSPASTTVRISAPDETSGGPRLATAYAVIGDGGVITNIFLTGELPQVQSVVRFKDTTDLIDPNDPLNPHFERCHHADLFIVTDPNPADNYKLPMLATNESLLVEKDFQAGGMVASQQGALVLNYGFRGDPVLASPPCIELMASSNPYHSGSTFPSNPQGGQLFNLTSSYYWNNQTYLPDKYMWNGATWIKGNYSGYFDTLFLFQSDLHTPAHLDVGNLNVHGDITGISDLTVPEKLTLGSGSTATIFSMGVIPSGQHAGVRYIMPDGDKTFGIGSLGVVNHRLAYVDADYIVTDHLKDTAGGGISLCSALRLYGSTPATGQKLYDATNNPGSNGQFLRINAAGLPVWTSYSPAAWDGGPVANAIVSTLAASGTINKAFAWTPSDISGAEINFRQGTGMLGKFLPDMEMHPKGADMYAIWNVLTQTGEDTGSTPIIEVRASINGYEATTRPLFTVTNNNSPALQISANKNVDIYGSSTRLNPNATGNTGLEIGNSLNNDGLPFIDFHYGVGSAQDYNVRLINENSGVLGLYGSLRSYGDLLTTGSITLTDNLKWISLRNGNTRLYSDENGILKVQDINGYLATLDTSNIFTDHINSASGLGIYLFDSLRMGSGGSFSKQENLLFASSDFLNGTYWWLYGGGSSSNFTPNTGDTAAPDGSHTATKFVSYGYGQGYYSGAVQDTGSTNGLTYTASIWAKGASGGEILNLGFSDGQYSAITLTTTWKRYTYTAVYNSAYARGFQWFCFSGTIYIWGTQLEQDNYSGPYCPTTNARMLNRLAFKSSSGTTAILNNSGGLGTLDASNIYVDHIAPASGGSMYFLGCPTYLEMNWLSGSPVACRFFFGDGTGWQLNFARGNSSSYADLFTFMDTGAFCFKKNGQVRLYNSSNGVLQVQNSSGELATLDASNIFVDYLNAASGGGIIYTYSSIYPANSVNLGCQGSHYNSVWADYLKYDIESSSFDALDDLTLVKNYTTKTVTKSHPITKQEYTEEVIDIQKSLPHLLDEDGFRDPSRDVGFLLGCMKFEVLAREKVASKVEQLRAQIQDLQTQLKTLKGGVSS